jgi:hypothetical protein
MNLITLCIPCCGRPNRLRLLLESLSAERHLIEKIIICNSTPRLPKCEDVQQQYSQLYSDFNIDSVIPASGSGPAQARLLASKESNSEFTLFLDEDLISRTGNIDRMIDFMSTNTEFTCCSGIWVDHIANQIQAKQRPLGFLFTESIQSLDRPKTLFKKPFSVADFVGPIRLDMLQASILIRTDVMNHHQFDPNYEFFLELLDFFYSLHRLRLKCAGIPSVVFDHYPGNYLVHGTKSTATKSLKSATQYFENKWNIKPHI